MAIDVRGRKPMLANITGGVSGPAIKPIALRMVYQVAAAVGVPIIGMGGIMGLDDALEFLLAGASAIQVGTAIFVDPGLPTRLIDELALWLEREGFTSLEQVVGIANEGFRLGERNVLTPWEAAGA
jgi:dihydroorotate dehydrogenase (NAD+) catalytic subunit